MTLLNDYRNRPIKGVSLVDSRTGRSSTEIISDEALYAYLSSQPAHAFNKRLFSYRITESLASLDSSYHSITVSSNKHVILFLGELTVSSGPVEVYTITGATWTPGTPVVATNEWAGETNSESAIQSGVTGVTGGVVVDEDFIPSAGNKIGGFSRSGGLVILPKGFEYLVQIVNSSNQTNKIGFFATFAEMDLDFLGV